MRSYMIDECFIYIFILCFKFVIFVIITTMFISKKLVSFENLNFRIVDYIIEMKSNNVNC